MHKEIKMGCSINLNLTLKKNYNAIDCMKLIMAIVVVAIHTNPVLIFHSEIINRIFGFIYLLAVPFFFLTSGFFLYNKICDSLLEEKLNRIKKWWKKVARLYIIWTVIYLPFTFYGFYLDNLGLSKSVAVFFRNVLFVGQNYCSWPLWYLLAMLVAGALIYLMEKQEYSYKTMLFLAILLTCLGYFINYLHYGNVEEGWWTPMVNMYYKVFLHTRNGFFHGLLYMLFGIGIAQYGTDLTKIQSSILFILSVILYFVGFEIAIYPACLFLFILVLSTDIRGKYETFVQMRSISTIIYFLHMIAVGIMTFFMDDINSPITFIIALLFSLLMSVFLLKKKNNKWFKLCFD